MCIRDRLFTEECKGALCAFNMETGHITNSLCVGRKTQYTFRATVHGKGGHAGNEFAKGRNALHEAVLKVADLIPLTDLDKGTSVTASVMHCGKNTSSLSLIPISGLPSLPPAPRRVLRVLAWCFLAYTLAVAAAFLIYSLQALQAQRLHLSYTWTCPGWMIPWLTILLNIPLRAHGLFALLGLAFAFTQRPKQAD